MARLLLVVLGWPVVALALLGVLQWAREAGVVPTPAPRPVWTAPPLREIYAAEALERYGALSRTERARFRDRLFAALGTPEQWLERVSLHGYAVLCLGEDHDDPTRDFLARRILPRLASDALLLEATPADLERIAADVAGGSERVALLDADITGVLAAAGGRALPVAGIEETADQRRARAAHRRGGSREASIRANFWRHFRSGRRYAVLYGALHCTDQPGWLYAGLRDEASRSLAARMLNVRVIRADQDPMVAAFTDFLAAIGGPTGAFAVPDTRRLGPRVLRWFPTLPEALGRYRAALVFGAGGAGIRDPSRRPGRGRAA